MRIQGFVIIIALLATSALAKEQNPKVRQAWARTYPQIFLSIQADNIGHVLVNGSEVDEYGRAKNALLFLLDRHGKQIASVMGIDLNGSITADSTGRIFVCSVDQTNARIECTAFAPQLAETLWSNGRVVVNPSPAPSIYLERLIPDDAGGVYVFGFLTRIWTPQLVLAPFNDANTMPTAFWYSSQRSIPFWPADFVRAPNGAVYLVGNVTGLGHYSEPVVLSYTSGTTGGSVGGYVGLSSFWYSAAACDKDSNLILVGGYETNAFLRSPNRCVITKRDGEGNPLWWIVHTNSPSGSARFVAVDRDANILVICSHGLTKYSPDGQMLWQITGGADSLRVDRFGNIFLLQEISDEFGVETPLITKLDPGGKQVWQIRTDDRPTESSYVTGLVCDGEGGIYLAVEKSEGTTIARLAEHGPKD